VLTGSYKAEFGHGSAGSSTWSARVGRTIGTAACPFSSYYKLDSSDSSKVFNGEVPFLLRWTERANWRANCERQVFFFVSAERILESRQLNFQFLPTTPPILVQLETPFNLHTKTYAHEAREAG